MRDKSITAKKSSKKAPQQSVYAGLNFDGLDPIDEEASSKPLQSPSDIPAVDDTPIDPTRNYSKYYTPHPKKGSNNGDLGRGPVDERKIQFSVTCTPAQKELFKAAAKKSKRKLPDFICVAVEEYIEKNNLK